jgi:hypothetical protein
VLFFPLDFIVARANTMKARVVGFDIVVEGLVTFGEFWDEIPDAFEIKYRKHDRFLYLAKSGGYCVGLLITSKDHRTSFRLRRGKGKGKIEVRIDRPEAGEELADVNVFVLQPETLRGFYLQYRGSCPINIFGDLLTSMFASVVKVRRKKALEGLDKPHGKAAKAVRQKFAQCKLSVTQLVRHGELDSLLARLAAFKDFEFEYSTLVANQKAFAPLDGSVNREVHRLVFRNDVTAKSVREAILKVIASLKLTSGKVHGTSRITQLEDTIDIVQNPDVFAMFDYDEIADEQAFMLDNVAKSSLVRLVISVANENKELLLARAK